MKLHKLFKDVEPYIVNVETPEGSGTGFLFAFNASRGLAAIATALHVVEHANDWHQPIKLTHDTSKTQLFLDNEDRAIRTDRKRDSAAIILRADAIKFPAELLKIMAKDQYKVRGVEVGWAGYPAIAPSLCLFHGVISAFVERDDSYLIDGVAINGVSGGPVFSELDDGSPQIVGIVPAYFVNRQRGEALPGLLKAQDITHLHTTIEKFKDLDEAKEKEREQKEAERAEGEGKLEKPAEESPTS